MSSTVPVERGVYIASRLSFARLWRALRSTGLPLSSTWIDMIDDNGLPTAEDDPSAAWTTNINEARDSVGLVLYCEEGNRLKGVLAEVGAALAAGKRVIQVGDCESLRISSTGEPLAITKHPLWGFADHVPHAVAILMGGEHVIQPEDLAGHRNRGVPVPDSGDPQPSTSHTFVG